MSINIDLSLSQNTKNSSGMISFAFSSSSSSVSANGNIIVADVGQADLIFKIVQSKFTWSTGQLVGNFIGRFPVDGSAISIYSDALKQNQVLVGPSQEFGAPVVTQGGMVLTVANANLTEAVYFYTLRIVLEGGLNAFEFDPLIRNTGPHSIWSLPRPSDQMK